MKTLDLLIATSAITHSALLLTVDADFKVIARAGVGLSLQWGSALGRPWAQRDRGRGSGSEIKS